MARCDPGLGVLDDRAVETHHVLALGHRRAPPGLTHVAQQLDAERAVVVGVADPPVDLGGLEHESPALAQGDDLVHQGGFGLGHRSWGLDSGSGHGANARSGALEAQQCSGGDPRHRQPLRRDRGTSPDSSAQGNRAGLGGPHQVRGGELELETSRPGTDPHPALPFDPLVHEDLESPLGHRQG